ncbi:MAG: DNA-protecting protein DprA [Chloroflexi bacterium]|nr:DNA-protecting protein DprA [Chloroflexota bacterium]
MKLSERAYWVGFNLVKGVGPVRVRRLLERFGSLEAAWLASSDELREADFDKRALNSFLTARQKLDLGAEMARLDRLGIAVLTWDDEDYPALLKPLRQIDAAPPLLYLRGTLDPGDEWALTVVGTRSVSAYGRQVTHQITSELALNRLTIVSGLARGVDGTAHQAALEAGGRTIALLGCGLDTIYPPEHRGLAAKIISQGAVMTPYPLGTQPESRKFHWRNNIMSGMARGVLVTEAGAKSGALVTVRYALEQGREVFAVPGNITQANSDGTNQLIRDGAIPVLSAQDILEALNLEQVATYQTVRSAAPNMSSDEQAILALLSSDPLHVDELTRQAALPVSQVSSTLAMLELKGVVRQVATMTYVRS